MRHARAKKRAWERGLAALNNIDETWSAAIGEYTEVGDGYYMWVPEHQKCWEIGSGLDDDIHQDGSVMRSIRNGSFDFEEEICRPVFECRTIPAHWDYIGYSVVVGTKNDGLIQPETARWITNGAWTPETPHLMYPENNYYYGDDPTVFPNGGWNHSEMMRYTRIYNGESLPAAQIQTPLKVNADDMRGWFGE
ncbi:MAG: hypothetical protein AUJ47_01230 [Candidatus Marinimicrobia bacterium CG1_02_48_14]|nr:MAG: hypothetical protein AUJ47_01230 [Candidatus Marinimicrobia bacterium CG1_02_48_14]